jgi:hypothetical protein
MLRISAESEAAKMSDRGAAHSLQTETNLAARKFYAQRNVYLTGFTLFLSLGACPATPSPLLSIR